MTDHTPASSTATAGSGARRAWLWAFVGFFLIIGAWSVAAPYSGTPDEQDHILRAFGVATGQVALEPAAAQRGAGAFVEAPKSLIVEQCWQFNWEQSAACAVEPGGDRTITQAATGAGRYFPLYYAIVGGPLAISPDWTGVLLARLISAALCAFLLATALTDAMRWSRHRLMAVGVIVAATPMVAHTGGAINPSGVELAAGIAFFAAAVPLLYAPGGSRDRSLLWHVGVAALALATLRMAGPLFLFLSAVALLLPPRWSVLRELWSRTAVRWWMLAVGLAGAISVLWTVVFKSADIGSHFAGQQEWSVSKVAWVEIQRWHQYLDEMVGVTSWLDTRMPEILYVVWEAAAAAVILTGFVVAHRAGRLRLVAILVGGFSVPYVLAVRYAPEVGFITQGRYLLPMLVGLPVLGAFLMQEAGVTRERSRTILRMSVVALLPLQLMTLAYTMVRWQVGLSWPPGLRSLNPFAGSWHPPLGSVLPIVASTLGLIAVGWLLWADGGLPRLRRGAHAASGDVCSPQDPTELSLGSQPARPESELRAGAGQGL